MDTPKITAIVPAYNIAPLLPVGCKRVVIKKLNENEREIVCE